MEQERKRERREEKTLLHLASKVFSSLHSAFIYGLAGWLSSFFLVGIKWPAWRRWATLTPPAAASHRQPQPPARRRPLAAAQARRRLILDGLRINRGKCPLLSLVLSLLLFFCCESSFHPTCYREQTRKLLTFEKRLMAKRSPKSCLHINFSFQVTLIR